MAQDFGDDIGEMLFTGFKRSLERAIYDFWRDSRNNNRDEEWYRNKFMKEGMSEEDAEAAAKDMAARKQACVPFGDKNDAAYFAKVCQENGILVSALTDSDGKGYVRFAKDDGELVGSCIGRYAEVSTLLKCKEINDRFENAPSVTKEKFNTLKEINDLPTLPTFDDSKDVTLFPVQVERDGRNELWTFAEQDTKGFDIDAQVNVSSQSLELMKKMVGKELSGVTIRSVGEPYHVKAMKVHEDTAKEQSAKEQSAKEKSVMGRDGRQGHDLANDPYSHTDLIRDKVLAAREQCRDFEDFKAILAENGIGTRINGEGELQFYEGRLGENGEMLDFVNGTDWPVNAKTLAGDKYQCDATLDWFEKNTPKEPSGIDSLNHAHSPIPPQKDLNLICNSVRSDLEERGIQTLDRADGKMGFVVDQKYKQDVIKAVAARFPGLTPEELGIEFDNGRNDPPNPPTPPAIDGSLDTDGRTPSLDQNIKSHDGMDTDTKTLKLEREQNGTDISPSMARGQSDRSRESYNIKSKADENRAASKQLSQTNDSPDRDISDKFQQER